MTAKKGILKYTLVLIPVIYIFFHYFILMASPEKFNNKTSLKYADTGKSIANLGYPVNSRGDDFSPSLTYDGRIMLFNSKHPNEKDHNIYITRSSNGNWKEPEYFTELNSVYNDETPFITPDGQTIVFASDRIEDATKTNTQKKQRKIAYDIFISTKTEGEWSRPHPVMGNINTIHNERSPSLTHDKKFLFFSRWPFKKLDQVKIYRATLKNGIYTDIIEMPDTINSGNFDLALIPSIKNSGFYFSSRRAGGYGGWDIYYAYINNGRIGDVVNLGPGVNSEDNDLFFSETADAIYLCSNRGGGTGLYDIYTAVLPGKIFKNKTAEYVPVEDVKIIKQSKSDVTSVRFIILNSATNNPVSAKFRVYLKDSPDPQKPELRFLSAVSNSIGIFTVIPKEDIKYIVVKNDGTAFTPIRKQVKVRPNHMTDCIIKLRPLKRRQPLRNKTVPKIIPLIPEKKTIKNKIKKSQAPLLLFRNIYFAKNSDKIRLEYIPYIHEIISHLRMNTDLKIKITGHSDQEGGYLKNKKISLKRAKTVRDYFLKLGLKSGRFSVTGKGNSKPVTHVKKYSSVNRRVEFTINK